MQRQSRILLSNMQSLKHCIVLFLALAFFVQLVGCTMENLPRGELIDEVSSPNEAKSIRVYLVNGGATVDYAIRCEVFIKENEQSRTFYWDYHIDNASVEWLSDDEVVINGHRLNVNTEHYDYREDMSRPFG